MSLSEVKWLVVSDVFCSVTGSVPSGSGTVEERTEETGTVALVDEGTPALTEANGGGVRTAMAGARRWVDLGLGKWRPVVAESSTWCF